ncbi:MAG: DUF4838 domain-containing protein [Planctomycetes bacterium]|nr:DUF4838 domain-containing protein [Planctomycetota bacterium]
MPRALSVGLFLSLAAAGPLLGGEPGLAVARLKGIRVAGPLTGLDQMAVKELQAGMKKLFGVALPEAKEGEPAVLLGKAAIAAGKVTQQELDNVSPGGYVIKCAADGIAIAGPDPAATLFGVYAFFEKLGVRFYAPSIQGAAAPQGLGAEVAPLSLAERPAFAYRTGRQWAWRQMFYLVGDGKKGLNPELFDEKKTGSDLWVDHSAGYLVPKLLFYDQHPEYYAMLKNGKRVGKSDFTDHRTPLCLSNPDVTRIATERALAWVKLEPDKRFFPITYGDTGTWCQCPECLKLDPEPGQYATRLLSWVNPVAKAVGEQFADRIIFTFAYGGSDVAPPRIRPEKNVWIIGSTGCGNVPFWDHAMARKAPELERNLAKINGWLAIVPQSYMVCEYLADTYQPALVDTTASRLRYYAKRGLRGIWATYGRPKNFTPVWEYLFARLMWNPEQDPHAIAEEFIAHHYGPAAKPVAAFFQLTHQRYEETLKSNPELARLYPVGYYSQALAEQAVACLSQAHETARRQADALSYGKDHRQSRWCSCAKCRAVGLASGLANEQRLFLLDWMEHPVSAQLDAATKAAMEFQFDRLLALTEDTPAEKMALVRMADLAAVGLEARLPGARKLVQAWAHDRKLVAPKGVKTPDGILLPAEDFLYAGFGPEKYDKQCPPKTAVAVYVKGNSANRSDFTEVEFELDALPGDGAARLEVEGQDCDHDVPPALIRIEVNGKKLFEGQASVVKRNWSTQSFDIPAGTLKKGINTLRIANVTPPEAVARWFHRWFMLASARVRFGK